MTDLAQNPDILVAGATGSTGGATATALAAADVPFRALSRRPDADVPEGGTVVVADLGDHDALARALEGVRAAYLVTPSSEDAEELQLGFVDAAAAAGVEHLVLLSQLAARPDSPVRFLRYHAAVEERLAESGMAATILRPNLFLQGLLALAEPVRTSGVVAAPIGDARVSLVDIRDIGDVAAVALQSPTPLGTLTLTGPAAVTHTEVAEALGEAIGAELRFTDIAPEDFAAQLRGKLPDWQVDGLLEDYAHYARGEASEVTDAVPATLGRPARDLAGFAHDYADAFRRG